MMLVTSNSICGTAPRGSHSLAPGRDIALYVHVPFCSSKCHFCSWVSQVSARQLTRSSERYDSYVHALRYQIASYAKRLRDFQLRVCDIYFGGGTPTVLDAEQLTEILNALLTEFDQSKVTDRTITIEASPDTLNPRSLSMLRRGGFDRLSIGVQSFDGDVLRRLGRVHDGPQAKAAVQMARAAGFENINLDLMFGLPADRETNWKHSVEQALDLGIDHLSLYRFYAVPGTVAFARLRKGLDDPSTDQACLEFYNWAEELLRAAGYQEYIFQLFSRSSKHCTMDETYFTLRRDWLGFGAGSQSLIFQKHIRHFSNLASYLESPDQPDVYLPAATNENLLALWAEYMLLTSEGIHYRRFEERLGISFAEACERFSRFGKYYDRLRREAHLQDFGDRLGFTDKSRRDLFMFHRPYTYSSV